MWEMTHSEPHPAVRSQSGGAGCYRSLCPEHASGVREAASRRALPYQKQKPPPLVLASDQTAHTPRKYPAFVAAKWLLACGRRRPRVSGGIRNTSGSPRARLSTPLFFSV